jgi:Flp pilus assembly protein TadB
MSYYGNPHPPGTPQWSSRQAVNEYRSRREEQRRHSAQRRRRAGGHGSSAGLWILHIVVAVVVLVIILSNITSWLPQLIAVLGAR